MQGVYTSIGFLFRIYTDLAFSFQMTPLWNTEWLR
jgi:hypothetical protein